MSTVRSAGPVLQPALRILCSQSLQAAFICLLTQNNIDIQSNTAAGLGGGLAAEASPGATVVLWQARFMRNSASEGGGTHAGAEVRATCVQLSVNRSDLDNIDGDVIPFPCHAISVPIARPTKCSSHHSSIQSWHDRQAGLPAWYHLPGLLLECPHLLLPALSADVSGGHEQPLPGERRHRAAAAWPATPVPP